MPDIGIDLDWIQLNPLVPPLQDPPIDVSPSDTIELEDDSAAAVRTPTIGGAVDEQALSLEYPTVGIDQIVWQGAPWRTLWARRTDGILWGATYRRDQNVLAWFRVIFAGGGVESIAVLPNAETGTDQLWLTVRREINGVTVGHVEVMEEPHYPYTSTDRGAYWHLDSALEYQGDATTTLTGLDHLEGQEVYVWADGAEQSPKTVASGAITLDAAASRVIVGVNFASVVQMLPLIDGTGELRRAVEATVYVQETGGFQIGPDTDTLTPVSFRRTTDPLDAPPPLFSGWIKEGIQSSYDRTGGFVMASQGAAPMTISGVLVDAG